MDKMKSICESANVFCLVEVSDSILHIKEIVLDAFFMDEGTLIFGNQVVEVRCESGAK